MPEQEHQIDGDGLADAIRLAAQAPYGLRLRLNPDEELRLVLTGSGGELTLFLAPSLQAAAFATPLPEALTPQEASSSQEIDKRVKLRGRVGTVPQYKPLPRRGLRVGFRFGEFSEGDKPIWHDVYATGRFAEAIRAKGIARGDELEVVGERQQAIRKLDDGSEQSFERIYCYGVSLKKRAQPRP